MNKRGFLATLAAMCVAPFAVKASNAPTGLTFHPLPRAWLEGAWQRVSAEKAAIAPAEAPLTRAWINGTWKPIDLDEGYYLFTPSPWTEEEIEVLRSRGRYIDRWNQDMAIERILPR